MKSIGIQALDSAAGRLGAGLTEVCGDGAAVVAIHAVDAARLRGESVHLELVEGDTLPDAPPGVGLVVLDARCGLNGDVRLARRHLRNVQRRYDAAGVPCLVLTRGSDALQAIGTLRLDIKATRGGPQGYIAAASRHGVTFTMCGFSGAGGTR